uniref:Reverse transcriptase domain-containing protein n=1 Tax=Salarias fasciatus TaxID=181472 RepID=A0A672FH63_SALFA
MVLLDLSAAFNTVDHHILINRLSHLVGLSGTVLNWFNSYFTDQCFYVSMDTCSSGTHEISLHSYADDTHYTDDTQLYADDTQLFIKTLLNCISDIKSWMAVNFLQLNQDKTEVLVIGPEGQREKILPKLRDFKPAQSFKNLGVIFDSELSFIPHIKNITEFGFYHLKNKARVARFSLRPEGGANAAFISCRLDYCNALLSGLKQKEHFKPATVTKLSRRADGDQGAEPHYSGFKVAALAPCPLPCSLLKFSYLGVCDTSI